MHFHPELMSFSQKEIEKGGENRIKKKRRGLHNDYLPASVLFLLVGKGCLINGFCEWQQRAGTVYQQGRRGKCSVFVHFPLV